MDDDEVDFDMPDNWWLQGNNVVVWKPDNNVRCIFAVQVHRKNKEIAVECTSQPADQTRNQQRETTAQLLSAVRDNERAAVKRTEREADPCFHREKKLRLMIVNTSILEKQNDMISKQLALFTQNEAAFVRLQGQPSFDNKLNELPGKLPDPVQAMLFDDSNPIESPESSIQSNQANVRNAARDSETWNQYDMTHGRLHPNNQNLL